MLWATLLISGLIVSGGPMGDDALIHYRWAVEFIHAFSDGGFYPRWFSEANWGQGSPAMLYYPPLPFYIVAVCSIFVRSFPAAIVIGCWLAFLVSGLTMYSFSRTLLSRKMSLIATLVYLSIPYHLFDLYRRSALSEVWAFSWAPLLLSATYRVAVSKESKGIPLLAIAYALMVLTHLPTTLAMTLLLPVFILMITRKPARIARAAAGVGLGAGLSAIFAMPLIFERGYVHYERLLLFNYNDFFLFANLGANLNRDIFGRHDEGQNFVSNGNWTAIGLLSLLLVITPLIWGELWKKNGEQSFAPLRRALWTISLSSLLMTTPLTRLVWQTVPFLANLQFPVRWLLITSVGASLLVAVSFVAIAQDRRFRVAATLALAVTLFFNLVLATTVIARAPYNPEIFEQGTDGLEVGEYRPIWWDEYYHKEILENSVMVTDGVADVGVVDDFGIKQKYIVNASTEAMLKLRPFYFPGWVARVDDRAVPIAPSAEGNIQLAIEPGAHTLTLSFEETWPRRLGKAVSFVTLVILLILTYLSRRRADQSNEGKPLRTNSPV